MVFLAMLGGLLGNKKKGNLIMEQNELEKVALASRKAHFLDINQYVFGSFNNSYVFELLDENGKATGVVCACCYRDMLKKKVMLLERNVLEECYRFDSPADKQCNGPAFVFESKDFVIRAGKAVGTHRITSELTVQI